MQILQIFFIYFMRLLVTFLLLLASVLSSNLFALTEKISNVRYDHTVTIDSGLRYVEANDSVMVTVRLLKHEDLLSSIGIEKLTKLNPKELQELLKGAPVSGADISLTTDNGLLGEIRDNMDGSYTAEYTASNVVGIALITSNVENIGSERKVGISVVADYDNPLLKRESALGKKIFNDVNLSNPKGQSCASCHGASSAFVDPDSGFPTSLGVLGGATFGSRNTPTLRYVGLVPEQYTKMGHTIGGLFWDGRAKNLVEQAKQPFLNSIEMNQPSKEAVVRQIHSSNYAEEFLAVYGVNAFEDLDQAYEYIAQSLAAFQQSPEMSPFTSKFDAVQRGEVSFTEAEARGFKIIKSSLCQECHLTPLTEGVQLFTNFRYETIGSPPNPDSKFIDNNPNFVDFGRGDITKRKSDIGLFRVPTLRNIAHTAPYFHNGVFPTLKDVIKFYSQEHEIRSETIVNPPDEFYGNDIDLDDDEIDDLISFLHTLTDKDILDKSMQPNTK